MSWPGLDWVLALQRWSPELDGAMRGLSFFGDELFFSALIPLLYWCVDATLGLRVTALLLSSTFVNGLVKWVVHHPRPFWIDPQVKALSLESAYGLPSGHAQNAVAVWPTVARAAGAPWLMVAAVFLIFGVSISRVYLGVHFPQDVLGGWLIGAIVVAAYGRVEPPAARWLAARPLAVQILVAVGVSMLVFVIAVAARATIRGVSDPPAWADQATTGRTPSEARRAYDPRSLSGTMVEVGTVLGAGVGLALMRRFARFRAGGLWWKRAARLAVGLVIVAILRFGLGAVLPREPALVGLVSTCVRYGVVALGVVWLAPWLFIKTGLAERA